MSGEQNNLRVWSLKGASLSKSEDVSLLSPAAQDDYGFTYCQNPQDIKLLMTAYKQYFKLHDEDHTLGDPVELHNALKAGKLYSHMLKSSKNQDARVKEIMGYVDERTKRGDQEDEDNDEDDYEDVEGDYDDADDAEFQTEVDHEYFRNVEHTFKRV